MKENQTISTWLRLTLMTLLFTLYGYFTMILIFLVAFVGGWLPVTAKLFFFALPTLFMALFSALLSTVLGMLVVNENSLPIWTTILFTLPEFAALQALGFGSKSLTKRLLRRRKGKKARLTSEEII